MNRTAVALWHPPPARDDTHQRGSSAPVYPVHTSLPPGPLIQFDKPLTAAAALLNHQPIPRRHAKRLTHEETLECAISKCFSGSTEKRLYQGEAVMTQEITQV